MTWHLWPFAEEPQAAMPQNGWDRLREAQDEARRNAQPTAAPGSAQNGWDRLREAQDEAARNAQPPRLYHAPQPSKASWDRLREVQDEAARNARIAPAYSTVTVPVAVPYVVPLSVVAPAPELPSYYYYAVSHPSHRISL